ncbi:MAG: efflux RND transporter permease subunit [Acidobacteriota bacterium]|nr:efflux RND transporter permease subunit [Acidobacteriota bacterium]
MRESLETRLPRFSLNRRVTVLVMLVTVIVLGTVATIGIPLELIPSGMDHPSLGVVVPWRDAPAQETLEKVVRPMEEELSTVAGISDMFSNARTGQGWVWLNFKYGTDLDVAYREVRDRVERARSRLPEDIDRIFIRKNDVAGIPIYFLGLAIDPAVTDVYNLVQDEIVLPLSRIDGVASVEPQGLLEKEILIELDRDKTAAAGLDIYTLAQALGTDNFTLSSGNVRQGGSKLLLRSIARYDSIEQLENRPVSPTARLGDVATVRYDMPEQKFRVRAMSRPAVALAVLKEGDANTLEVAARVNEVVEQLRANPRLELVELAELFDQGDIIRESLGTLLASGRIGGLIALLVLFFFLRRFRMTLIVTLSIPLSIIIALTVMFFADESLNILTLLALMISVGLLVDNSVVVAENIFRLHRDGLEPRDACVRGAGEIALAIVMATLTTIAVFLPVSLVEGQGQFFLLRLSIPISVALLGSLLVALIFVPLSVFLTLPTHRQEEAAPHPVFNWLKKAYDGTFGWLNDVYTRILAFFMHRRLDLGMILVALFALSAVPFQKVKIVDTQDEDRGGFSVQVELPNNTTLEEAERYFLAGEAVIEEHAEELDLEGWFLFHRATFGEFQGWFRSPRTNKVSPREATRRIMEALPEKGGVRLFTGEDDATDDKKDKALHAFVLEGEDARELERVARDLEEIFLAVDGVLGVKKTEDQSPSELALVLDRERAQTQGIDPTVVSAVVGYALRGQALRRYSYQGKQIPVTVRFREQDRDSLDELSDFQVPAAHESTVPLSALTEPRYLAAAAQISRTNKKTGRNITLELEEGREEETRERLLAAAARIDLPEGIAFGRGDAAPQLGEDVLNMLFAAAISIVFIYLLMGFLFESFILPLSILCTIPLASLGVYWAHLVAGLDIDFLGVVGLILLVGVVVNNGIVLIDYVNRLREEGLSREDAVAKAAERRFRPIMMTALTTIGGMIPLTLGGASSIGLSYKSFGLTLIGGLTSATLLTLLVVPIFYTLFDDAREIMVGLLSRVRRRGAAVAGRPATTP